MSKSLNIPLTDELKKFVITQSGSGTFYSTPSEYVRDLIRRDRDRQESLSLRNSIVEGYQDAIAGRSVQYSGDLKSDLKAFKSTSD